MTKNVWICLTMVMLALVGAVAYAQATHETRLASILYTDMRQPSQPTSTPAQSSGVVVVADLTMPFNVLGGVDPSALQDANGDWYISVFRIDAGANNGLWILRWQPATNTLTPIGLAAAAQPALFETQDAPISNSRGVVAHNFDSTALYVFGWLDREGGSRRPKLRVAQVLDYKAK